MQELMIKVKRECKSIETLETGHETEEKLKLLDKLLYCR